MNGLLCDCSTGVDSCRVFALHTPYTTKSHTCWPALILRKASSV